MVRRVRLPFLGLGLLGVSTAALACADGMCEGGFNLIGKDQSCQGRAMLAPGNDSRINLLFLLADRGGRSTAGLTRPNVEYGYVEPASVFLDWRTLRAAFFPTKPGEEEASASAYSGSRCQSYTAGSQALSTAMAANRALPTAERTALIAARIGAEEVCRVGTDYNRRYRDPATLTALPQFGAWPAVNSQAGRHYLAYLQAADAFYGDRFDAARDGFRGLASANDPWLRETAAYMLVRVEFAAAQAKAISDYGNYEHDKVDRAAVKRGLEALAAYLKANPQGRYAKSGEGLLRRGMWLAGQYEALSARYAAMLKSVSPQEQSAAVLIEEVDTKLLFEPAAKELWASDSLLLASQLLLAMRDSNYTDSAPPKPGISAAALDALAPRFAGHEELFGYLQATHAYYYTRDYRRVLQLIPDDARRSAHSNLSFSRQVLRGMALAGLNDRNEAGFWQELIGGSKGLWQRPLAELGLAMNWERTGKLDSVFAAGSPITDPSIRSQLVSRSAGPELLRSIVRNAQNSVEERDQALDTLLANELVRGRYAAFGTDLKLPLAKPDGNAQRFSKGKVSDDYPCAPLATTVAALARNPGDIPGRLCLGDFMRLHGLDYSFGKWDATPRADELGGFTKGFSGDRNYRSQFYAAISADPKAAPNDKAYALYRAVMCYAPSGFNDCGGEDVAQDQRKAWFERLKREYPKSKWAQKLRYYW